MSFIILWCKKSIKSQAVLQLADVTRVLGSLALTDLTSTAARFLKLPLVEGEATEV